MLSVIYNEKQEGKNIDFSKNSQELLEPHQLNQKHRNQLTNHSTHFTDIPPMKHPTKKPTNEPINKRNNQLTDQPINPSLTHSSAWWRRNRPRLRMPSGVSHRLGKPTPGIGACRTRALRPCLPWAATLWRFRWKTRRSSSSSAPSFQARAEHPTSSPPAYFSLIWTQKQRMVSSLNTYWIYTYTPV